MLFSKSVEERRALIRRHLQHVKFTQQDGVFYLDGIKTMAGIRLTWLCDFLFYLGDEKSISMANAAIPLGEYTHCHMTPMRTCRLFKHYGHLLTEEAKTVLLDYLRYTRSDYLGDEMDFVGVNDNFPIGATYAVYVMAELLHDHDLYNEAVKRIHQIERMLKRRGVFSEYNSGYTQYQLYLLANLEEVVQEADLHEIVVAARNRNWFDYLCHFHPDVGTICGPFAREYLNVGERESMNYMLDHILHPRVQLAKLDRAPSAEETMFICNDYEIDDHILELVNKKQYPFEFMATAECSASTDSTPECAQRILEEEEDCYEYSAGEGKLYTYMTPQYALGTASKEWHSGVQTSSFSAIYKRSQNICRPGDVRDVICRYLINDETVAGQRFFEQGRKTAIGKHNHAVVLYKPKIAALPPVHNMADGDRLTQHYRRQEITGNLGVTSAKLVLLIPLQQVMVDEIYVNDQKLETLPAYFTAPASVYIKDGDISMAVHPLEVTNKGRQYAMSISIREDMLEIALFNYSGERKNFAKRDFLMIRNGFAFAIQSADEVSFEAFMQQEKKTQITDRLISTMHSRQTIIRSVSVKYGEHTLACEVAPVSEGIKFMTYDDYEIEIPKLYTSDFDVKTLPLM